MSIWGERWRVVKSGRFRIRNPARLAALYRQQEDPAIFLSIAGHRQPLPVRRPGHLGIAGGKAGQFPLRPAQRGHSVDAAVGTLAEKRNPLSVRGPGRIIVASRGGGEPQRIGLAEQFHVDARVVTLLAIPTEGDLLAIRGEARIHLRAWIGGYLHNRRLGEWRGE